MRNADEIVIEIPLKKLWHNSGKAYLERIRYLNEQDIKNILQNHSVEFVVADVGKKLEWINVNESFPFWKGECEKRIVNNPDKIELDVFPSSYGYLASEWKGKNKFSIILLEKYH